MPKYLPSSHQNDFLLISDAMIYTSTLPGHKSFARESNAPNACRTTFPITSYLLFFRLISLGWVNSITNPTRDRVIVDLIFRAGLGPTHLFIKVIPLDLIFRPSDIYSYWFLNEVFQPKLLGRTWVQMGIASYICATTLVRLTFLLGGSPDWNRQTFVIAAQMSR